ncbi:MAG: ribosomal L7Ae/L30e/S12e/Gadd45 family protein [Candidatus Nanoarchaeia archaeon]|nr:ribosomal L7Ae/L30e/S12e/Gadd45 family protein [Candidatus Nanoarchaeia archaeon]
MSVAELRKVLKEKTISFGIDSALKKLRAGKAKGVFLANNASKKMRDDLEHYTKLAGAKFILLDQPSTELQLVCKRGHPVTVISY